RPRTDPGRIPEPAERRGALVHRRRRRCNPRPSTTTAPADRGRAAQPILRTTATVTDRPERRVGRRIHTHRTDRRIHREPRPGRQYHATETGLTTDDSKLRRGHNFVVVKTAKRSRTSLEVKVRPPWGSRTGP